MESTRRGVREYVLTNGQKVLVDDEKINDQGPFTFLSLGSQLIAGIVSGKPWIYVFLQREIGAVYRYVGNAFLNYQFDGAFVLDVSAFGPVKRLVCHINSRPLSASYSVSSI